MSVDIAIGIESFAELRRDKCYYVDKTGFLEQFLQDPTDAGRFRVPASATLFTRPRRFGKTLFLSMLAEFFDITKDSRELFAGLKVSENEALCREWMNRYPVISLTLKRVHGESFESTIGKLRSLIGDVCLEHKYLLTSAAVDEDERETLRKLRKKQADNETLEEALLILTRAMFQHHGKPAILLIDEYDVPLSKAEGREDQYGPMPDFLREFLSNGLKTNKYLKFGILTGCRRITLGDFTTGLNHMKCYDIASRSRYEDLFGFTQDEVDSLLAMAGFTDRRDSIREWYDGYCFGDRTDIYCPWSIMEYVQDLLDKPDKTPEAYWVHTGACELPGDFIRRLPAEEDVRGKMAALLAGFPVAVTLNRYMNHSDIFKDASNFWTLLYLAGYLTPARNPDLHADDLETGESLLVIPNREVRSVFSREVMAWIRDVLPENSRRALSTALWAQDVQEFEKQLAALLTGIGFHDAREMYCHGILYTAFAMQYAGTSSNRESGLGRYDVLVPDREHGRGALLEFKRADSPEQLEESVQKALDRIVDKRYDTCLRAEGYGTILHVGVAFCQKTARVAFRKADTGHGEKGA